MTVFDCIMLVKMSMTIETMLHVIKTKCQGNSFSLLNVVPNGSTEYHKIKNNNKINGISNMRNVAKVIITAFAFSFRYIGIINLLNPFHKVLKFRAQIAVICVRHGPPGIEERDLLLSALVLHLPQFPP